MNNCCRTLFFNSSKSRLPLHYRSVLGFDALRDWFFPSMFSCSDFCSNLIVKTSIRGCGIWYVSFKDLPSQDVNASQTEALRKLSLMHRLVISTGEGAISENVIGKLSEGKASHVPYRDSKLTRLLKTSLSGHGHVSLICTVTPASTNMEETHNTLKFASRAKRVEIYASRNKVRSRITN
ncbi:hypothetical protein RIF29_19742 [Crotalaria pallida]|uniref:Kinesin motor domain-containing protein n=1 Tax=Crotalaria pallida TaxID=3830 RepID=A0AAN9F8C4_CROPI